MPLPYTEFLDSLSPPFIHPSAVVEGMVDLERGSSVWGGSVLRGDMNRIQIGTGVNIQDNSTIHTDSKKGVEIGDFTLVGHNTMIHGCKIGRACLIGIGAIVLDDAEIGDGSMITAGCLIRGGMKIEPKSMVVQKEGKLKIYPGKARYLQTLAGSLEYIRLAERWQKGEFAPFTPEQEASFLEQARILAEHLAA